MERSRAPSKEPAGPLPRLLAVPHGELAVDDDVVDAGRMAGGLQVGGLVRDGRRIEHHEVGEDPSRTIPRSRRPTRAAGTEVSLAIAVSSDSDPRSRTYVPSTRAVDP